MGRDAGPHCRRREARGDRDVAAVGARAWTTVGCRARVRRTSERDRGQRSGRDQSDSLRTESAFPWAASQARSQLYIVNAMISRISLSVSHSDSLGHRASVAFGEVSFQSPRCSGLVKGHQGQECRSTRSCSRAAAFARNARPLVGVGSFTNPYAPRPT